MTKQDMAQDRMANMAHQKNIAALKKDPNLTARLNQMNNLGAALNNLSNAEHLTPQQFDEAQQAIRANLGIKGSSGIGERDKTQLNDLGLNADRWAQFLTGKPADIDKNDPMLGHIKDLARLEQDNINKQVNSRISAVTGGNDWLYSDPKYKKYKDSLDSLIGATKNQFNVPSGGLIKQPGLISGAGAQSFTPDVIEYAVEHGITPELANQIKIGRGECGIDAR